MSTNNFFTSQEHFYKFKAVWANAVNSPKAKHHLEPFDEWFDKSTYKGSTDGLEQVRGGHYWLSRGTGCSKVQGWIHAEHSLLYNILRGKELHKGFTPVTNPNKQNRWTSNMNTFYLAVIGLENRVRWAESLIEDDIAMDKFRKENGVITVVEKLNLFLKGVNENIDLVDNERFIALVNKIRKYSKKPKEILSPGSRDWRDGRVTDFLEPFNGTVTVEMLAGIDGEQLKMIQMFNRQQKTNYWLKSI